MDDKSVKKLLHLEETSFDQISDSDSIKTSQIIDSSNRTNNSSLVPEDLNLRYQNALIERRRNCANIEDYRRAEMKMCKLMGQLAKTVVKQVRQTIDNLHTTKRTLPQGTIHEDAYLRIQFVSDYQASCPDVEGRAWLQQELLASQWLTSQDHNNIHTAMMVGVEYKGFKVVAMIKLPLAIQRTGVFNLQDDVPLLSEQVLSLMRETASSIGLLPSYPWRLSDGRTIQMALHPSVQIHQVQTSTLAHVPSVTLVGKQAGKLVGGGTPATHVTSAGYYMVGLSDLLPQYQGHLVRPELIKKTNGGLGAEYLHQEATANAVQPILRETVSTLVQDLDDLRVQPIDSLDWTDLLHSRGISCSYLAEIMERVSLPHLKDSLRIEMIARTLKTAIRQQLRQTVLHFRDVQALLVEEELASTAVNTVNALINSDQNEWKSALLEAVSSKYNCVMNLDMLKSINPTALFVAVQHHSSLQFHRDSIVSVASGLSLEPKDFIRFLPKVTPSFKPVINNGA